MVDATAMSVGSKAGTRAVHDLIESYEGSSVTLWARTRLDDAVVAKVRSWLSTAAGRDLELDVRINPAQDAGAVLYFGDQARIVLDERAMWLADVQRELRQKCADGAIANADAAYSVMQDLLVASQPHATMEELVDTGAVMRIGDGVAVCSGLRDVESQELVEFEGGVAGIAFSLAADRVGCLLLGAEEGVREGSAVRRLREPLRVPVGETLLGRVVDPMGRPIDDAGAVVPITYLPAERPAPGVVDRRPVDTPLHTGWKTVDALVPIGRGQRELIIGDRKIGKTTLAVDTILAQKDTGVACIYCAIGQKASSVRAVIDTLAANHALANTTIVAAMPSDPPAFRYVAPYTACAMGEYFRDRGKDALVVFDDLTKHAAAYREMSALLERPIGREAYPGDIFYVHSKLLERASCLSVERGSGTLTALPIIETLAGDISAFIPTNIISICDGQIVLDTSIFNEGRRPAMEAGLSVSRVGGAAQTHLMKSIAGRLRIDIAQYEEMAQFVKFGAEVDTTTAQQLVRGERAQAVLGQNQHSPMPLEEEILVLSGVVRGLFDDTPPERMAEAEAAFLNWVREHRRELLQSLATAEVPTPELDAALDEALAAFAHTLLVEA